MAEGDFDYFYYEKDLFGNVIGVYNENGYKLIEYSYDTWGNCKYTYKNGGGSTCYKWWSVPRKEKIC